MNQFRTVRCDMWRKDDWFSDLAPDAKLLWIYTFTNDSTSPAGIYRIALRTIANDTGISLARVQEIIAEFQQAGKLEYENGIIWPVTMRKHQCGEIKALDNLLKKINKDVAELPDTGIVARYKAYYSPLQPPTNALATPLQEATNPVPVNRRQETGDKREGPTRATHSPPTFSNGSGYSAATKVMKWNSQVSAELRTPIADTILDILGKRQLADIGGALGDKFLDDAHENAVALYKLGYKTPEDLLAIEAAWRQDWRGKTGGTAEQLTTFASEYLNNGRREVKPFAVEEWR
jgi:hypothetical protein